MVQQSSVHLRASPVTLPRISEDLMGWSHHTQSQLQLHAVDTVDAAFHNLSGNGLRSALGTGVAIGLHPM